MQVRGEVWEGRKGGRLDWAGVEEGRPATYLPTRQPANPPNQPTSLEESQGRNEAGRTNVEPHGHVEGEKNKHKKNTPTAGLRLISSTLNNPGAHKSRG